MVTCCFFTSLRTVTFFSYPSNLPSPWSFVKRIVLFIILPLFITNCGLHTQENRRQFKLCWRVMYTIVEALFWLMYHTVCSGKGPCCLWRCTGEVLNPARNDNSTALRQELVNSLISHVLEQVS